MESCALCLLDCLGPTSKSFKKLCSLFILNKLNKWFSVYRWPLRSRRTKNLLEPIVQIPANALDNPDKLALDQKPLVWGDGSAAAIPSHVSFIAPFLSCWGAEGMSVECRAFWSFLTEVKASFWLKPLLRWPITDTWPHYVSLLGGLLVGEQTYIVDH